MGMRRGFTLIEMLVVIAIIIVIAAMLFPVLGRARGKARVAKCAAHLRQIGLALRMYADDYDDEGPPTTGWHLWGGDGQTGNDHPGPGWEERIEPYVNNLDVYRCPDYPRQVRFSYFLNTRCWWVWQRRGYQWGCAWVSHPYIQDPAAYIVAGDCWNPNLLPPPTGSATYVPEDSCDKDNMTYQCLSYGEPHGNGSNVVYADGHVKFATRFDPQTMTFSPVEMADWQ